MRSLVLLLTGLFSSFYIDLRFFKKRSEIVSFQAPISLELSERKEKLKQKQKKYKNRKYKRKEVYQKKHYKLKGTQPKNHRYSNHQSLRRMYRST